MTSPAALPVVTDLLADMVTRCAALAPVGPRFDPARVLVVGIRGKRGPHGKRAACHFTRFPATGTSFSADGRFELPRVTKDGRELLYIVAFVLPRYLLLDPAEQRKDVFHELLHMDPDFTGRPSRLRHGAGYDACVEHLDRAAAAQGLEMPRLPGPGEVTFFRRFRPMPAPFRRTDRSARKAFDAAQLELATLRIDAADGLRPPPRYLYVCPGCGREYPRRRRLAVASCSRCAPGFDPRFKLLLSPAATRPP